VNRICLQVVSGLVVVLVSGLLVVLVSRLVAVLVVACGRSHEWLRLWSQVVFWPGGSAGGRLWSQPRVICWLLFALSSRIGETALLYLMSG
jgi:hypothetical protein